MKIHKRHYRKTSKLHILHLPAPTPLTALCFWISSEKSISRQRKRISAKFVKMPALHLLKQPLFFFWHFVFFYQSLSTPNFFLSYIYVIVTRWGVFRKVLLYLKTATLSFKISIKGIGPDFYVLQIKFPSLSSLS